jgi:hypothetical protein
MDDDLARQMLPPGGHEGSHPHHPPMMVPEYTNTSVPSVLAPGDGMNLPNNLVQNSSRQVEAEDADGDDDDEDYDDEDDDDDDDHGEEEEGDDDGDDDDDGGEEEDDDDDEDDDDGEEEEEDDEMGEEEEEAVEQRQQQQQQQQQQQPEVVLDPLDGVVKLQLPPAEEAGPDNQNTILSERRNCAGFEENIVLGKGTQSCLDKFFNVFHSYPIFGSALVFKSTRGSGSSIFHRSVSRLYTAALVIFLLSIIRREVKFA